MSMCKQTKFLNQIGISHLFRRRISPSTSHEFSVHAELENALAPLAAPSFLKARPHLQDEPGLHPGTYFLIPMPIHSPCNPGKAARLFRFFFHHFASTVS